MDIRFLSSKNIVGKLLRDYGLNDSGLVFDSIEWMMEALEKIGTPYIYSPCTTNLTVTNYLATPPCAAEKLGIVVYNDKCICWVNHKPCITKRDAVRDTERTVALDGHKLRFNFTALDVTLHYLGFPLDDEGFPMIIDNPHVKEALTSYILMKLIYSGVKHPVFNAANAKWLP